MDTKTDRRKKQAALIRFFRKIHRTTGAILFVFFFLTAVTGLSLGWKKHSGGYILPESYKGSSADLKDWISIDSLHTIACKIARDSISPGLSLELERIDVRPDKGMVKFVFLEGFWGVQLDGATGKLLHIERRRSDFIENIHDGSILDHLLGIKNEILKLIYTTIMGLSLLLFTITGFWLWIGPKRMKNRYAV